MISRRDFMKAGLATGMFFTLPPILKGCAGSGGSSAGKARIARFHLDLSDLEGTHPGSGNGTYFLRASGRKHKLVPHSQETLALLPSSMQDSSSNPPTHFAQNVSLARDSVSLLAITHQGDGNVHNWLHMSLSVPATTSPRTARTSNKQVCAASGCVQTQSTSDSFVLIDKNTLTEDHLYAELSSVQTAACMIFLHPELMSLDSATTSKVADHIWGLDQFYDLYCQIALSRYASTNGDNGDPWATLVPAVGDDGNPLLDQDGDPIHHIVYSQTTKTLLAAAISPALQLVKGDASLTHKNYRHGTGVPEVKQQVTSKSSSSLLSSLFPKKTSSSVSGNEFWLEPTIASGTWKHGIHWTDIGMVGAPADRQFTFTLTNAHLRNFSIYIQYLDENNNPIDLGSDWSSYLPTGLGQTYGVDAALQGIDFATSSLKFVDLCMAPATVIGVPVPVDDQTYKPKMPPGAVTARIRVGSLGIPHSLDEFVEADSRRAWAVGLILTLAVNVIYPSLMLCLGSGEQENKTLLKLILSDKKIWLEGIVCGYAAQSWFRGLFDNSGGNKFDRSVQDFENAIQNLLVSVASDGGKILLTKLGPYIAAEEGEMKAEEAIPIAGAILQAATVISTQLEIGQTTTEIMLNPLLYTVDFRVARSVKVTINHDRRDFKFPSTATYYTVAAVIPKGTLRSMDVSLPTTTQSDPLTVTLSDIPTGGTFNITVNFYDQHKNLVGTGSAAFYTVTDAPKLNGVPLVLPSYLQQRLTILKGNRYTTTQAYLDALYSGFSQNQKDDAEQYEFSVMQALRDLNLPNYVTDGHDGINYECTIEEKEYPLSASSTYNHKEKIVLENGQRTWKATSAPTDTRTSLSNVAGSSDLHELTGMALIQRSGQFGYVWRSSGSGLPRCGTGVTDVELYTVQNISLGQHSQQSFQSGQYGGQACGVTQPLCIVYDLNGPSSGRGRNFILVPRDDIATYVRPYVADGATPLTLDQTVAFGRFNLPLAAVAYHASGYLVGVSREYHKLQILELPATSQTDANAPRAVMYGGFGALPGLLSQPCGIGVDASGVIHVLETGNRRLQAFDIHGQPTNVYSGGQSCFLALPTGYTFLDLAVNGAGWLYLLGYASQGALASDYRLFVHQPGSSGTPLFTVSGIAAGKILVDKWRDLYTLNYEKIILPAGRVEPSVSHWIPDTPNPGLIVPPWPPKQ